MALFQIGLINTLIAAVFACGACAWATCCRALRNPTTFWALAIIFLIVLINCSANITLTLFTSIAQYNITLAADSSPLHCLKKLSFIALLKDSQLSLIIPELKIKSLSARALAKASISPLINNGNCLPLYLFKTSCPA